MTPKPVNPLVKIFALFIIITCYLALLGAGTFGAEFTDGDQVELEGWYWRWR